MSLAEVKRFKEFLKILPHSSDVVLVILKGHLLIEQQLVLIIENRVKEPSVLDYQRIGFNQLSCFARSLLNKTENDWIWNSLNKLNKLRNLVAHQLKPALLEKTMQEFIETVPAKYENTEILDHFELMLWHTFVQISSLVERQGTT